MQLGDVGMPMKTLSAWVARVRRGGTAQTTSIQSDRHSKAEIVGLKKALAVAEMERDILKKAVAYFAKDNTWSTHSSKNISVRILSLWCVACWMWAKVAITNGFNESPVCDKSSDIETKSSSKLHMSSVVALMAINVYTLSWLSKDVIWVFIRFVQYARFAHD